TNNYLALTRIKPVHFNFSTVGNLHRIGGKFKVFSAGWEILPDEGFIVYIDDSYKIMRSKTLHKLFAEHKALILWAYSVCFISFNSRHYRPPFLCARARYLPYSRSAHRLGDAHLA